MKIFMFFLLFFASLRYLPKLRSRSLTYNVENFFDTRDNPTKNDDEFLTFRQPVLDTKPLLS